MLFCNFGSSRVPLNKIHMLHLPGERATLDKHLGCVQNYPSEAYASKGGYRSNVTPLCKYQAWGCFFLQLIVWSTGFITSSQPQLTESLFAVGAALVLHIIWMEMAWGLAKLEGWPRFGWWVDLLLLFLSLFCILIRSIWCFLSMFMYRFHGNMFCLCHLLCIFWFMYHHQDLQLNHLYN